MCCVRKSIEFAWRWYGRQNVHLRCIVKITVVGFIYLWPYVTLGDLNSSQLLTPTENPNTPWCKKRVCVSFHRRNGLGKKSFTLLFFVYDLLNSKEDNGQKKAWERGRTWHGVWNSHNSPPVPDLTLTITWKRLDDYHFLLRWYFGFFDWTDSFTQPSTASLN